MARLQLQMLRRIAFFSSSRSLECLGEACRGFASNSYTFSNSCVVNKEERSSRVVLARSEMLGHFKAKYVEASGFRTLATESSGKGGDDGSEKPKQPTKIDGGKKYSVVQIDNDGSWRTVLRNAVELGVHPRDVSILASSNPFISQRSTITVVHNEKIMVRMENARALLCRDHVLLFEARRPRSFGKDRDIVGAAPDIARPEFQDKAANRARELFGAYMSQQAREPIAHLLDAMPFHLRMLECLLDDTSSFFYEKTER